MPGRRRLGSRKPPPPTLVEHRSKRLEALASAMAATPEETPIYATLSPSISPDRLFEVPLTILDSLRAASQGKF
jgi:hypothetical protein